MSENEQSEDQKNENTTIMVKTPTRQRIKKMAAEEDCNYDTLIDRSLDAFEEQDKLQERIEELEQRVNDLED